MKLLPFIKKASSRFHTVEAVREALEAAGYTQLSLSGQWELKRGAKYYVIHQGSELFAFKIGNKFTSADGVRIAASHGDFPGLSIKPNPEIVEEGYLQFNVECYGGVNLTSWLDRPLSIAGRVVTRSENVMQPNIHLVDFEKPVLSIPNIAIHLEREMNKGVELNKQTHMLPIAALTEEKEEAGFLNQKLAEKLNVKPEDILDYELMLYNVEAGALIGFDEEFISAPRLDNLTSVQASLEGLLAGEREEGINLIAIFDHEEIGSKTKQGAGSVLLAYLLEKIYISLGYDSMSYKDALGNSLFMSVDVSHALHPNYVKKNDPTNKNILNKGICIKESCSQSYATDCEAIGIVQQICKEAQVPCQKSVNRSDTSGGSTLGSIASTMVPMRTVDLGIPLLAMHSACEMMGVKDQESLIRYLTAYFSLH